MIYYMNGDLLDVTSGIIVHGCNAQGVMGSGVAKAIKQKYPGAFRTYQDAHQSTPGGLKIGEVIWHVQDSIKIANAITQEFYGTEKRHVNYAAVVKCFTEVIGYANTMKLDIYFPKIGAGLGGGDWSLIEQLINDCDPRDKVKKICVVKDGL
jgi:O-acetyl-ADP-ribose deacetylase (regulator of RNase III)